MRRPEALVGRDERRFEEQPNWGVSGFTSNPFTKLKPGDGPKRS